MNNTLSIVLGSVLLALALFLIIAVLLQNGKSKGTGVVTGGAETFFGKNKAKAIDKKLSKLTIVAAVLFIICSIVVFSLIKAPEGIVNDGTGTGTGTSTGSGTGTGSDELVVDTIVDVEDLLPDSDTDAGDLGSDN